MSFNTLLPGYQKTADIRPIVIYPLEWINESNAAQQGDFVSNDHFKILWVNCSPGSVVIDNERYDIKDDSILCVNPGRFNQFIAGGMVKGMVISFSPDFLGLTAENFGLLQRLGLFYTSATITTIHLTGELKYKVKDLLACMMNEFNNYPSFNNEVLSGFLKILLIYLSRQDAVATACSQQAKKMAIVHKFIFLLENQFVENKQVTDYAGELVVTPGYLNAVVKRITGATASHHIQQRIILQAKRQAACSDLSMKEIAYKLGFEDIAHFSKFFKKFSGQNFTDFKRNRTVYFT